MNAIKCIDEGWFEDHVNFSNNNNNNNNWEKLSFFKLNPNQS